MIKKDKIFELRIEEDDEISGIDSISLVSEPAIEVNWLAFKKEKEHEFHIPEGEDHKYLEKLESIAQNEQDLFDDGFQIKSIEVLGKDEFISTDPNGPSFEDREDYKVRYKYILKPSISQSPIINTTRDFCKTLINRNYVWRIEDMEMTQNDFGDSAMVWRGGYNCRHVWARIEYTKDATIINKASVNKGKVEIGGFPTDMVPDTRVLGYTQPSTVTSATAANPSPSTIRNLGLSKEKFELPLFPTKEEAERLAPLLYGCEGSHEHVMDGKTYYMPCLKHPEDMGYDNVLPPYVDELPKKKKEDMESYSDYPDSVKNNAKAVLKYVEENGWGDCGTDVGKQRANQLANGEPISEDTIKRMYSYLSRHEVDLQSSTGYGDGCGKLMYDSWGGKSALSWAESKINAIEKEKMSKQNFAIDSEEKKIVIGPAMIPDQKIFRKDAKGNPYNVFFTADTIRMIAEKYMRNKYIDNNDTEHNGKAASDVYVIESWIKEDMEDKSNKYGFNELPIGTWFVSMKVKNNEVWEKIKNKELNGFSVSGYFEEVAQFCREEMFLKEVSEILKKY